MWKEDENPSLVRWFDGHERTLHTMKKSKLDTEIARYKFRTDIQTAADRAGLTIKVRREIRRLESQLRPDEYVLHLSPVTNSDERGLFVVTTSRVLFVFSGWVYKRKFSLDHQRITDARWYEHAFLGDLYISTYGGFSIKLQRIWKPVGRAIHRELLRISKMYTPEMRDAHELSSVYSFSKVVRQVREEHVVADQILSLDEMFKNGELEKDAYIEQKMELLKGL